MDKRTVNSIVFLILGIALLIFLFTYFNMNSYSPKLVPPCFKFRCDFSGDGNTKLIGPTSNVSVAWKNSGNNSSGPSSYNTNSPVTDGANNIYIANPSGYKTYDNKGNLLSSTGILYKYGSNGKIIWSFNNVDGTINTTPCIGNNYIYFGCNDGYLYALNFDSRIQWKYFVGGNSILSSPTFDKYTNNVYIGSSSGLVAVDNNGKFLWKYITNGIISTCPAIDPNYNIVYFTCTNGYLYAVNTSDGSLKWRYQAGDAIQSSPAIGPNGTIYFGCNDGYLYAVNPPDVDLIPGTGNLVWKFNNNISTGQITSSPAVDSQGYIYYTCLQSSGGLLEAKLYILNPNGTQNKIATLEFSANSSPLIDKDKNVFVGSGNYIYGFDKDLVLLWKLELGNQVNSSPVLDNKSNLVVGCNDGFLYSIIGE
jgi:outer membrane protein assembly factor BamB